MFRFHSSALVALAMVAWLACGTATGQGGFGEADSNQDGKVTASELEIYVSGKLTDFDRFDDLLNELDQDKNGSLSEDEFAERMTAIQAIMSRPRSEMKESNNDKNKSQDKKVADKKATAKKDTGRKRTPALKVGDVAPTFTLKSLDGKSETDLAEYKGKMPVVLIFGSYT